MCNCSWEQIFSRGLAEVMLFLYVFWHVLVTSREKKEENKKTELTVVIFRTFQNLKHNYKWFKSMTWHNLINKLLEVANCCGIYIYILITLCIKNIHKWNMWLHYKKYLRERTMSLKLVFNTLICFIQLWHYYYYLIYVLLFLNGTKCEMLKKNPSSYIMQPDSSALPLKQYSDTGDAFNTHLKE